MENLVRAHVLIKGQVQGVFFRKWVKEKAEELGLTGWAQNLTDGRVEVVAEGEREKVNRLIELIRKGPRLAKVEHIDVSWEGATGEFGDFEIRR